MNEAILHAAEEMQKSGSSAEEIVTFLHSSGCTVIESIKAVKDLCGLSLGGAKVIVSSQSCWKEESAAADALHSELLSEMEKHQSRLQRNGDAPI